jgi:hypothetical protein
MEEGKAETGVHGHEPRLTKMAPASRMMIPGGG